MDVHADIFFLLKFLKKGGILWKINPIKYIAILI